MKRNRILLIIIIVIAIVIGYYTTTETEMSVEQHTEFIQEERDEQERFMRYNEESPFVATKTTFDELSYYPPNLDYRLKAQLKFDEVQQPVTLGTNDGKQKQYLSYATATFEFENQTHTLKILEDVEEGVLFLPFGDATSAIETYGAGRYLDLEKQSSNVITLDFNLAYNPYCAYVDGYTCPLPPRENLLDIPIYAGEKTYQP